MEKNLNLISYTNIWAIKGPRVEFYAADSP